jgi:hypothetical protein
MPVLGVVVVFEPGAPTPPWLGWDPRLVLGVRVGDRLPVVVSTELPHDDRAVLEAVAAERGVVDVQVAFAEFSDVVEVSP